MELPDHQSLYERLGGHENLEKIVYGVYDLMRADSLLGPAFDRFARTPATVTRLKQRTVDYLEWVFGGPHLYLGSDLYVAHASMNIDDLLYTKMMGMYKIMLEKTESIDDDTRKDVLEALENMRGPIVDIDKQFQREFMERWEENRKAREEKEKKMGKKKKKMKSFEARLAEFEGPGADGDFFETMGKTAGQVSKLGKDGPSISMGARYNPLDSNEGMPMYAPLTKAASLDQATAKQAAALERAAQVRPRPEPRAEPKARAGAKPQAKLRAKERAAPAVPAAVPKSQVEELFTFSSEHDAAPVPPPSSVCTHWKAGLDDEPPIQTADLLRQATQPSTLAPPALGGQAQLVSM